MPIAAYRLLAMQCSGDYILPSILTTSEVMVIVWRLRGNIIRTVLILATC